MSVKEFIDAVSKQPAMLNDQLVVVTATKQLLGGEWDGGVQVTSKPVQSVSLGFQGILLFVDPKAPELQEIAIRNAPQLVVAGPTPEALKHLLPSE